MIKVHHQLWVGGADDEAAVRGKDGWYVVTTAKDPWHRQAVGYITKGAPKDHFEYLVAERRGSTILNLVDAADPAYIPEEAINAGIEAIEDNIHHGQVLVHCNQGVSRSPTIALLWMKKFTDRFAGMDFDTASAVFKMVYPAYAPAAGMAGYARAHWEV